MPLLSSRYLQKHRELRLAHLALSMMTMGYIWQEGEQNTVEVPLWLSAVATWLVLLFFVFFSGLLLFSNLELYYIIDSLL